MKIHFIGALCAAIISVVPATAQQYPTIVGEWYAEEHGRGDCGTPWAIHIGPKHWAEDSYVCSFDDVARDGWEVTWNGTCSDGSTSERMTLVATEQKGRLFTSWNGYEGASPLRRCTAN